MSFAKTDSVASSHVIVVGGGFAGVKCAMQLAAQAEVQITLFDRNNYQQFHPLLYQVATSILLPGNAGFALRDMFRDHKNVDVQMEEVTGVDLERRAVTTGSGKTFEADYLVLATGSHVNFYGVPGAEQHALPLYSLADAERLRSVILRVFETADRNPERA